MNRRVLRLSAMIGAAAVSTLAVAPAFAAAPVSSASAQSLNIGIVGQSVISQVVTSSNDGTTESKNDASTLPTLAGLLPSNNLIGAGVAPQEAVSKKDGTSYACAGVAGTGGGIVTVGDSACKLDGRPLTINLADLSLGNALLSNTSALGSALNSIPGIGTLLATLTDGLNTLVGQVSGAVNGTPLGIKLGGSLSAVEATCSANPEAATGTTHLVDSSGGNNATPITLNIPGVAPVVLLNLPANPAPNTKLVTGLSQVTQMLVDALTVQLNTMLGGVLAPLNLGTALQGVQAAVLAPLVTALQPLLAPIEQYLLNVTLNKQVSSQGGKKIEVTAVDAQVVPAIAGSLLSGEIGKVTCGPNTKVVASTPTPTPTPETPATPDVPTVVDSGLAGHGDNTTRTVLTATAALMLLAGTAGLLGYRRMLSK